MKKKNSYDRIQRITTIVIVLSLLLPTYSMYSNSQIMMMISESENNKKPAENSKRKKDHTLLRNSYNLKLMSPEQQRLFNLELELKRKKLNQGDERIKELRKLLKSVKVYRTNKEMKKRKNVDKLFMVKYNPELNSKVIERIRENGKMKRNGKSLANLMKKGSKKNPFEEIVAVEQVIEKAEEPIKEERKEEKKEIKQMLKKMGKKRLFNIKK